MDALREAIANRPQPKQPDAERLVFLTRCGGPWGSRPKLAADGEKQRGVFHDPIAGEFRKVLERPRCPKCGKIEVADAKRCTCKWKPTKAEGWGRLHRKGLGFYALRHTFETVGGDGRDQIAVDFIMGHAPGRYGQCISRADRRRPARSRDGTREEVAFRK